MKRVVVTGIGVISPNGFGKNAFAEAIRTGRSGIRFIPELESLGMRCQVGGIPELDAESESFLERFNLPNTSRFLKYGLIAGLEAWKDAGLQIPDLYNSEVDYDSGSVLGTVIGSVDLLCDRIAPMVSSNQIKKLRSDMVEQTMVSAPSAHLTKILALGNANFGNSNACASGTDAIIMGAQHIQAGRAKRMLVGGIDCYSPNYWCLFDLMRVLSKGFNDRPEEASRPMSQSAAGFVPGAGGAVLLLEELEEAQLRGATIYAEIAGGFMNTGGQRKGGTMTAPNSEAILKCIEGAVHNASIKPEEIDLISGHLTATKADAIEVNNWKTALGRSFNDFPYINSLKSMTGHLLGGAGAIETAAALIEMQQGFIHPNLNCEDVNSEILSAIRAEAIPHSTIDYHPKCIIKASFGFGDVNSCLVLKEYKR